MTNAQRQRRYRRRHQTPRQRIIQDLLAQIRFLKAQLREVRQHPADYLDDFEDEDFEVFMQQTEKMVKVLNGVMNRAYPQPK